MEFALTLFAMSRRDPRCVTHFARNFGSALNLVLDPMILQDSHKRCAAFALHLESQHAPRCVTHPGSQNKIALAWQLPRHSTHSIDGPVRAFSWLP